MSELPKERIIAYIDGFNLYFGLRDSGLRRCYWLNVQALVHKLLKSDQQLLFTKYFTARISGAYSGDSPATRQHLEARRKRQSNYLEVLGTLKDFRMYEGHYLGKDITCRSCRTSWRTHEEKMTDVQIATELLTDAFTDQFDMALLISADSDLIPPIRAVRLFFPDKRVVVGFPPARYSKDLEGAANASLIIGRGKLKQSQFPDDVKKADGYVIKRPEQWR